MEQPWAGGLVISSEFSVRMYEELQRIATQKLSHEKTGRSWEKNALVHECYLRMRKSRRDLASREHFYATAAQVMRHVLVDDARGSRREKRGGGQTVLQLDCVAHQLADPQGSMIAVAEALQELAKLWPRQKRVVELRVIEGFEEQETASILNISVRTVRRDWAFARTWLRAYLER